MTILDYIKQRFSTWSVNLSDELIDLELTLLNIDSSVQMSEAIKIDEFFYNVIPNILNGPNSISEGGYSISFDKSSMLAYYKMLAKKLGKNDLLSNDNIKDISNQW